MKKLRIYERPCNTTNYELKLIGEYNVRKVFEDSFYHRPIETLSAKRCREILNTIYPHFKADNVLLVFEWVDSGFRWTQELHRQGTILIG